MPRGNRSVCAGIFCEMPELSCEQPRRARILWRREHRRGQSIILRLPAAGVAPQSTTIISDLEPVTRARGRFFVWSHLNRGVFQHDGKLD
jgi:hypothetical protein